MERGGWEMEKGREGEMRRRGIRGSHLSPRCRSRRVGLARWRIRILSHRFMSCGERGEELVHRSSRETRFLCISSFDVAGRDSY